MFSKTSYAVFLFFAVFGVLSIPESKIVAVFVGDCSTYRPWSAMEQSFGSFGRLFSIRNFADLIFPRDGPCPVGTSVSVWYPVSSCNCFFFSHCFLLVSRHFFLTAAFSSFSFSSSVRVFRVWLNWLRFSFNLSLYLLIFSLDLQLCLARCSGDIFLYSILRSSALL